MSLRWEYCHFPGRVTEATHQKLVLCVPRKRGQDESWPLAFWLQRPAAAAAAAVAGDWEAQSVSGIAQSSLSAPGLELSNLPSSLGFSKNLVSMNWLHTNVL